MPRRSSGELPSGTEGNRPPPPPPPLRFPPMDHISALPNDVITRIFSFLPFKDVVKTSALSRRWRYTWTTTTPHLAFDKLWHRNHGSPYWGFRSFPSFPALADKLLRQCASAPVTKFHITHFSETDGPKLDRWLRFAEEHPVEDLRLRLANNPPLFYKLPRFLYCLSGLVRLEVSTCCFWLDGATGISWPRLKVLSMEDVELSDVILGRILKGSPVLESLTLARCQGVNNIVIDSKRVKDLVLIGGNFIHLKKIWAPHLLSLCVSGTWEWALVLLRIGRGIPLDDVSSLVEAKLDFVIPNDWPGAKRMWRYLLKELFEKLRGVPTITIGGWCLQIMSHSEMEGVPSPLTKCQNLILEAPVSREDLPGIAYMLRSSPCLEKLVILLTNDPRLKFELDEESENRVNFYEEELLCLREGGIYVQFELDEESEDRVDFDEEEFLCLREGNLECLAKHLKRVEIIGIGANSFGSNCQLALIKFLLGDALVLEKMVIKVELPTLVLKLPTLGLLGKLHRAKENVNSFRKASENAKVIFDWGPHISI